MSTPAIGRSEIVEIPTPVAKNVF